MPLLLTLSVPELALAAPMVVVPAPLTVSIDPAPVIVAAPVVAATAFAMLKESPTTVAPLSMFSVEAVPATLVAATPMPPNVPVLPLEKVRLRGNPHQPDTQPTAGKARASPSTVTVPFPTDAPINTSPVETLPPPRHSRWRRPGGKSSTSWKGSNRRP